MSFDAFDDLNWLAVIVAAIVWFALGAVWYMPKTFGTAWMRSIGWEPSPDEPRPGASMYVAPLVAYLVGSVALGLLTKASGTDTVGEGIVLGLIVAVGIVGSILFVTAVFDPKKPNAMLWLGITWAYHLVGVMLAALILAAWD
jgi:uncharacterized protein DUF1761